MSFYRVPRSFMPETCPSDPQSIPAEINTTMSGKLWTFFLLTLPSLAHTMDVQLNGQQGRDLLDIPQLNCWNNQRAPKVQIWARRNQMKLSGKRTLSPTNSGKFVLRHDLLSKSNCRRNDTDGVNLVH